MREIDIYIDIYIYIERERERKRERVNVGAETNKMMTLEKDEYVLACVRTPFFRSPWCHPVTEYSGSPSHTLFLVIVLY